MTTEPSRILTAAPRWPPAPPPLAAARGRARPGAGAAIKLGTLTPLTGAGGSYGPRCARRWRAVVERGQRGGRRARPQGRAGERGRPDQSRGRGARGAQADRRRQGRRDHGHLGLGGDHRGGAAVLGEQDVPDHRVGRGHDHPAAAPGLSDPHPAQHPAAGRASSREFMLSLGAKRVFILSTQTPFAQPTQQAARPRCCPRAAPRWSAR